MRKIIPNGLMIILITMGCIGPGGLFNDEEEASKPFVYDLTLEDLWLDIPKNMTKA